MSKPKVAINNITGDSIISRSSSQEYLNNYDGIFRKRKEYTDEEVLQWKWVNEGTVTNETDSVALTGSTSHKSMESTLSADTSEDWDEDRIDIIGSNGNDGLGYIHLNDTLPL